MTDCLLEAAVMIGYASLFSREPSKWQIGDVEHLGRLVFALSVKQIDSIPLVSSESRVNHYIYFTFPGFLVHILTCRYT